MRISITFVRIRKFFKMFTNNILFKFSLESIKDLLFIVFSVHLLKLFLSLQVLIKHRSTVIDAQTYDGSTPLMDACRFEVNSMVEDLINTGAKVNIVDNQGM